MAWWEPLGLALAMGTWAGMIHAGVTWYRQHVLHEFTWTSRDLSWMSPVGNLAILCAPALLVVLVRALRPAWGTRGVAAMCVGVVASVSILLTVKGLHPAAVVLLAFGLAIQAGRIATHRPAAWMRAVRWAAALGLLFTGAAWARAMRTPQAAAGARAAPGAPNVLVLILDTVRAASTSLHGYERATTPTLERLASEGARFDWAISPSSWTLPSHAAMFTGQPASRLSASWRRPLDGTFPTVAEQLTAAGYRTGAFVANLYYTHHESGVGRGFQVLSDFRRSRLQLLWSTTLGQSPLTSRLLWGSHAPAAILDALRDFELTPRAEPQQDRRRAMEVVDEFLAWQGASAGPFFAFLNLYDAHDPYDPPAAYRTMFAKAPGKQDLYDAGIRYMDDELARLVGELDRRGALDRTLLVVTSDHGEQWGERGLHNHGNSLYLPAVHVPLVMRFPPGVVPGTRVTEPVSLTHLAATILDVTGAPAGAIPGASLLGRARPAVVTETEALDPSARVRSPAERGSLASIIRDSLQFIRNGDSTWQLLDIRHDAVRPVDLLATTAGCARGVELDSVLRSVSRVPATPPFVPARCAHPRGTP